MYTTFIPFPNSTMAKTMANCRENAVIASVEMDGPEIMMELTFEKSNTSSFAMANEEIYELTGVSLTYNSMDEYFPNHAGK